MASLFSSGIGSLLRTLASQSCGNQALRCNSGILSSPFCATIRWFTNSTGSDNRPKRPLSAYIRYVQEQQPLLKKEYPGVRFFELTKQIAVSWSQLSETQKQVYVEAAEKDRQAYKKEIGTFEAQLSGAQLGAMQEAKRQRRLKRKKMRRKRELTVLGKPKRPRSAFNIFMAEHFQEASGNIVTTKLKALCEDWNRLPDAQKQPYIQLAQDDRIRYENEMKSWEEQMLDLGREDLVRRKNRKRVRKPSAPRTAKQTESSGSRAKKTSTSKSSSASSPPKNGKPERTHTTEE